MTDTTDLRRPAPHLTSGEDEPTTGATITVVLNGTPTATIARDLSELCDRHFAEVPQVATALNGQFIARSARAAARLADGDAVEVLSARAGG